jgi:hypothetical protein
MQTKYGRRPKKLKESLFSKQRKLEEEQIYKLRKAESNGNTKED